MSIYLRLFVGGGLILRMSEFGFRDRAVRIIKDGKTTDYELGGFRLVSLAEVREVVAFDMRRAIKWGDISTEGQSRGSIYPK